MIGIIGIGNMGSAIADALAQAGVSASIFDIDSIKCLSLKEKHKNLVIAQGEAGLVVESDVLIIATKPQLLDSVLEYVSVCGNERKIIVSIAAGVSTKYIESKLNFKAKIIRGMPNLAAKVANSMTALCKGKYASDKDLVQVEEIFEHIGVTLRVKETEIDKITAVSGSGPGYIFHFLDLFQQASQKLGFSKSQAKELVLATARGAVALINDEDEFADLCNQVCSKGGTTEAGINAFNASNLDKVFEVVLNSAYARAQELGK